MMSMTELADYGDEKYDAGYRKGVEDLRDLFLKDAYWTNFAIDKINREVKKLLEDK